MKACCRFCGAPLETIVADLGMSPISNDYIAPEREMAMEPFYPLRAYACGECFLVQLIDFAKAESMFSDDYAYFSSYSESWLAHVKRYAQDMIAREKLGPNSMVVEIASNDGYLLQYFKQAGVPTLGVEPTANTARVALEERGIESEVAFFGKATAERLRTRGVQADLIAGKNVLAHVPDVNDFVSGYPIILKPEGVVTVEFPHLLRLIEERQFDTIYHEHFSYLSLDVVAQFFAKQAMRVFDVEEQPTHGGSLRVFACHDASKRETSPRVAAMIAREKAAGLQDLDTYRRFAGETVDVKCALLDFLIQAKREGKSVAGYGAPAKGNTLLNYAGVKPDLLPFTVDRSPHKIGKLLPGSHIPIRDPQAIFDAKPDYVLILPWNIAPEIMAQMTAIKDWGGKFVTPIPTLTIHP